MSDQHKINDLQDKEYLADGVYVGHDGYQFWLYTERVDGTHIIALDDYAFTELKLYVNRIQDKYKTEPPA